MTNLIEDQYREQLSERFSEILRIESLFHNLKNSATKDYNAGIIDYATYQEVQNATYYAPLSWKSRKYAISEEDRLLVLKYGRFINNGELSLSDLETSYSEIIGRFDSVAKSVKNYYSFYNLSLEELRAEVLEFVKNVAADKIAELKSKIEMLEEKMLEIKPQERSKSIFSIEIKQYRDEIAELERNEQLVINSVMASDHDSLMRYICKKMAIREEFYKWFRVRKNKEKITNGELKTIELSGLNGSRVNAVACKESINTSQQLINYIVDVNGWITDFALNAANVTNDIGKRQSIGRLYTKDECFKLFKKFYTIESFLNYLPSYLDNDNSLSELEIFKIFYLENFLDYKKVDPDKFRITLIKSVLDYYRSLVVKHSVLLKEMVSKAAGNIDAVVDCNVSVTKNVIFIRDAIEDINDETDYLNGFLSNEEAEELYESLNKYFDELEKLSKGNVRGMANGKGTNN